MKSAVFLAFSLMSPKKKLSGGIKQIFTFDTVLFGMFTGGLIGLYRILFCKLKAIRKKDDKWNCLLAGFISSFIILIDRSKGRRVTVAVYALARSVEALVKIFASNEESVEDDGTESLILKFFKGVRKMIDFPIFLMCVLHIYIAITWYYDFKAFPPGLDKPIKAISGPKKNDWHIIYKITRPQETE